VFLCVGWEPGKGGGAGDGEGKGGGVGSWGKLGGWGCERTVETLAMAENLSDVARHDLVHLRNILIQLADITLSASVQVQLLRLLDE